MMELYMDGAEMTSNVYRIFMEKPLVELAIAAPRSRCDNNINMDVREVSFKDVKWMEPAQDTIQ
jgi:hypothetical protein